MCGGGGGVEGRRKLEDWSLQVTHVVNITQQLTQGLYIDTGLKGQTVLAGRVFLWPKAIDKSQWGAMRRSFGSGPVGLPLICEIWERMW